MFYFFEKVCYNEYGLLKNKGNYNLWRDNMTDQKDTKTTEEKSWLQRRFSRTPASQENPNVSGGEEKNKSAKEKSWLEKRFSRTPAAQENPDVVAEEAKGEAPKEKSWVERRLSRDAADANRTLENAGTKYQEEADIRQNRNTAERE